MSNQEINISTDIEKLNIPFIHQFISNTYWAKGRTIEEMEKVIQNSFNFGVFLNEVQVGYARIVTDFVVFAYLMDVFIDDNYRKKGYAKILIHEILHHPKLKDIQIWRLATSDAHQLYKQFGFTPLAKPETMMEKKKVK